MFDIEAVRRRAERTKPGVDGVRPVRPGLPRAAYEDREALIEEVERLQRKVASLDAKLTLISKAWRRDAQVVARVREALDEASSGPREEG